MVKGGKARPSTKIVLFYSKNRSMIRVFFNWTDTKFKASSIIFFKYIFYIYVYFYILLPMSLSLERNSISEWSTFFFSNSNNLASVLIFS